MAVKRVTSSKRDREKAKQSKREEKQKRKKIATLRIAFIVCQDLCPGRACAGQMVCTGLHS